MLIHKIHVIILYLALSAVIGRISVNAAETIRGKSRILRQVYEIPRSLWLQLPDSIKLDHPLLLSKLRSADADQAKLLDYATIYPSFGNKGAMDVKSELMFPSGGYDQIKKISTPEFFQNNGFLFPSSWESRDSGSSLEFEAASNGKCRISSDFHVAVEWIPALTEGSPVNLGRSEMPWLSNIRNNATVQLTANSPVLISAMPDPRMEYQNKKMILIFNTLIIPNVEPSNKSDNNIILETMLIRGEAPNNLRAEDVIKISRKNPSNIIISSLTSSIVEYISHTSQSITESCYPTDGAVDGEVYIPKSFDRIDIGTVIECRLVLLDDKQVELKLGLSFDVAPPKFPMVPGKGKNVIDLSMQLYRAAYMSKDENVKLSLGEWRLLKSFKPEDIKTIKGKDRKPLPGEAYPANEANLDRAHYQARNSSYMLMVRVISHENALAGKDTNRLLREELEQAIAAKGATLSKPTWAVSELASYVSTRDEMFENLAKSHPELNNKLTYVTDIRPWEHSFIGRSKIKLTSGEAADIATKTGAVILDVGENEKGSSTSLDTWLKGSHLSRFAKDKNRLAALMNGKPCFIRLDESKGMADLHYLTEQAGELEETCVYLFKWDAPGEEMDQAARNSGQFLQNDADIRRKSEFYTGEWEYRSEGSDTFRHILFPDGRAELWRNGRQWEQDGRYVWDGFRWKIREDGAVVILEASGVVDSVYKASGKTPNQIIHEDASKTTIPTMQKAVDSWLNPKLGSRESLPPLAATLRKPIVDRIPTDDQKPKESDPLKSTVRTLTDTSGKTVEAELLSATDTVVEVRILKNDKTHTIPLKRLSNEDQEFIKKWWAEKH